MKRGILEGGGGSLRVMLFAGKGVGILFLRSRGETMGSEMDRRGATSSDNESGSDECVASSVLDCILSDYLISSSSHADSYKTIEISSGSIFTFHCMTIGKLKA